MLRFFLLVLASRRKRFSFLSLSLYFFFSFSSLFLLDRPRRCSGFCSGNIVEIVEYLSRELTINYPLAEIWIKFSEIVESTEEKSRIRCTSRRIHPSESSVATSLRSLRVTNRKRGQWSRRFVASIKRSKNLINELENVTNYITQCISQMIYQDNQGLFLHSVATFFWEDQKRLWTVGREITADN